MANLEFLTNVSHNGVVIPKDAIVSDTERELLTVAQNLIDRGYARVTDKPATHTAVLVGPDQYALPKKVVDEEGGAAPSADAQIEKDAAARAASQQPVAPQAPAPQTQPTPEEVAAAAAAA